MGYAGCHRCGLAVADERVEKLPEAHRSWLERDVVYIILGLDSDQPTIPEGLAALPELLS